MNIAICDDDRKVCSFFEEKIKAIYKNADVKSYFNADEIWNAAAGDPHHAPDILLLDIQMNGMNGMELARKLRSIGWKTILIFITAYADYVFDAFDVGAFHYLVKPVSDKKFEEVLHKAEEQFQQEMKNAENADTENIDNANINNQNMDTGNKDTENRDINRSEEKRITVKRGGVHTTVKVSDIIYAEVFNRKVVLHTTVESIEYYGKLKSLEEELGGDFYRPHRAYLVNLKYVTKYDKSSIFMQNCQVMMAKQNYAGFVKAYMSFMKREYGAKS